MCPLGWTVSKAGLASVIALSSAPVNDVAEAARRRSLVLLPHRGRRSQVLGNIGVVVGLLLVALLSELEQLTPGVAELTENRPQRVQTFADRVVRRRHGPQVVGGLLVMGSGVDERDSTARPRCNSLLPLIRVVTCLDCVDEGSDAGERARRDDAPIADIPHFVGADAD